MAKKIRYKAFSFRIHKRTYDLMLKEKIKSGLSWNKFFYKLIQKYVARD